MRLSYRFIIAGLLAAAAVGAFLNIDATEEAIRGGGYSAEVESNMVGPEGGQVLVDRTVEEIKKIWDNDEKQEHERDMATAPMISTTSERTLRLDAENRDRHLDGGSQSRYSALKETVGMRKIRAALVGFGEINTPREIIERKCSEARRLLEEQGVEITWTEPVSDDSEGKDVARAKTELAGKEFDLLVVCVAGWIPSHAVIDVVDQFKHKPMLLWGLSGWHEDGRFVTTADQAGTTALRKPMQDLGYTMKYVANRIGCPVPMDQVMSFARAARAATLLRGSRIGQMGYRDMRLYGTLYDGVSLRARIGPEVEFFEMLEMAQAIEMLDAEKVARLVESVKLRWTFVKSPQPDTIGNAPSVAP